MEDIGSDLCLVISYKSTPRVWRMVFFLISSNETSFDEILLSVSEDGSLSLQGFTLHIGESQLRHNDSLGIECLLLSQVMSVWPRSS
jgi:hypothetical protein